MEEIDQHPKATAKKVATVSENIKELFAQQIERYGKNKDTLHRITNLIVGELPPEPKSEDPIKREEPHGFCDQMSTLLESLETVNVKLEIDIKRLQLFI